LLEIDQVNLSAVSFNLNFKVIQAGIEKKKTRDQIRFKNDLPPKLATKKQIFIEKGSNVC